jgi:hypothetical protein
MRSGLADAAPRLDEVGGGPLWSLIEASMGRSLGSAGGWVDEWGGGAGGAECVDKTVAGGVVAGVGSVGAMVIHDDQSYCENTHTSRPPDEQR